jgi:RNA-directed DNA polymerase
VVTYADDFVVLCHSREQAEQVRDRLSAWLAVRGLAFNEDKTRITKVDDGFDFLSFNIRRYHVTGGTKVLTRPSRGAMTKMRRRIANELRALRGASPAEVIWVMNPIIRGQANYYRIGASSKSFQALDEHLWQHLYKWVRRRHPRKPRKWAMGRYFGPYNPARRNKWVFGDRETGAYLHYYAWTKIVRHAPVPGANSPDDPALTQYWAERRRKRKPPQVAESWQRDLRLQHGCCPLCREPLLFADHAPDSPTQWESWYAGIRKAIGHHAITLHPSRTTRRLDTCTLRTPSPRRPNALSRTCRCQLTSGSCLSRVPRRVACTVLRRPRRGNVPGLSDNRPHWVRDVTYADYPASVVMPRRCGARIVWPGQDGGRD